MAKILVTSGPTRQYLDPVRFISNASSGQMGSCLAMAALELGHEVVVVSGPVDIAYPASAKMIPVVTTQEMLDAVLAEFPTCDGLIGAAAPCDYRPEVVHDQKIKKDGDRLQITLVETPDVVAAAGDIKRPNQWTIGFALETDDAHFRAIGKLHRKSCDLVVLNGTSAIESPNNRIDIIDPTGNVVASGEGPKLEMARLILSMIPDD